MQIVGGEEHGQPGALIGGVRQVHGLHDHPHQEVRDKEVSPSPDQKLSPRMMLNCPDGKQERREGTGGQAKHGPGGLLVQGGHHQARHEEGTEEGGEGGPG